MGDTICVKSDSVTCLKISDCDDIHITDYVNTADPIKSDLFVERTPDFTIPVFGIKLNGILVIDGNGNPINIPIHTYGNPLYIGYMTPSIDPTSMVEYLDYDGKVICGKIITVLLGTSPLYQANNQRRSNTTTHIAQESNIKIIPNPAKESTQIKVY